MLIGVKYWENMRVSVEGVKGLTEAGLGRLETRIPGE